MKDKNKHLKTSVYHVQLTDMRSENTKNGDIETTANFKILNILYGEKNEEITVFKAGKPPEFVKKGSVGIITVQEDTQDKSKDPDNSKPTAMYFNRSIYGPIWIWISSTGSDDTEYNYTYPNLLLKFPIESTDLTETGTETVTETGKTQPSPAPAEAETREERAERICQGDPGCLWVFLGNGKTSGDSEGGPSDTGDTGLPADARLQGW